VSTSQILVQDHDAPSGRGSCSCGNKKETAMLLLRLMALTFIVIAAALVAFALDAAWAVVLAVLILFAALVELFLVMAHYTSASDQEPPSDQIILEEQDLVERETGLPTRRRWNEPQAREYADEVARRGLVAVPDGWRGPEGAHRVLLVTTGTLAPQRLRQALPDVPAADDLAVLVVVPTLARNASELRRGDASEPVAHAETIARETVAALGADQDSRRRPQRALLSRPRAALGWR